MTSSGANKSSSSNKQQQQNEAELSADEVEEFADGIMFKFDSGDHVISRWRDGQGFVATVDKVDVSGRKLYVRYEDGTRSWADIKDVRTEPDKWDVASCSQCLLRRAEFRHLPAAERAAMEEAKSKEPLYRCYDCGWRYHESCHTPRLTPSFLAVHGGSAHFICRTCVFMRVAKTVAEERDKMVPFSTKRSDSIFQQHSTNFGISEAAKRYLPYSLDDLMWKEQHTSNEQNAYCYCGGPAKWYFHMFQCGTCRQWFHENCVRASVLLSSKAANKQPISVPTLNLYDTFFSYTCAKCSPDGLDSIDRFPATWLDILNICILNVSEGRAKVSLRNIIIPWLKEHIKEFVLASDEERIPTNDIEWFERVSNIVKSSPARFTSSFSGHPNKASSPQANVVHNTADPWCQFKTRAILPRRLPEIKPPPQSSLNGANNGQRHMRVRAKKSNGETVDDSLNSGTQDDQQSVTTSSSGQVLSKRGRKHGLNEAATVQVLKKMAGVAQLYNSLGNNNPDLPEYNAAPFFRLMPSLHNPTKQPFRVSIPSQQTDSYFNIGQGEYALVQPLHIEVTGASTSPAISASCSPSVHLVGAKKRKAYHPLHTISASSDMNRRQNMLHDHSSASDGISNISSISPVAMIL